MSFNLSLQDILQALQAQEQERLLQQQQQQQPRGYTPLRYYDDDEESEDHYAPYPDYYPRFTLSPRQGRAVGGYPPVPVQPPVNPAAQSGFRDAASLEAILGLLAGQYDQQIPQTAAPTQTASSNLPVEPQESKEEVSKGQASDLKKAPQVPPLAKKLNETHGPAATPAKVAPLRVLKRHSFSAFKEPEAKIEISARNVKNSQLPYSPQTNVYETETEYSVVVALPGAQLKDLDIDFHPSSNEIIIKGVIPDPSTESFKVNEIRTGSVERRVKFPTLPKIQDDEIKAKYANGLLSIKVPKEKEVTKPKRKVTIEEVPDEELEFESHGGIVS